MDIHDHDIRLSRRGRIDRRLATLRLADQLEAFDRAMNDEGGWVKKILGG